MYSREKRRKAVELYIKYDCSAAQVIRELGYPASSKSLKTWHAEYLEEQRTGVKKQKKHQETWYTLEEKERAVAHYYEHGQNLNRTVRQLGYPSRQSLAQWIEQLRPKARRKRKQTVRLTDDQKRNAVIDLCMREGGAKEVALQYGISREYLYQLKWKLLAQDKEQESMKRKKPKAKHPKESEIATLQQEVEDLQKQVQRLRMENDILEMTAELLKKDKGVDPKKLTNKEKAELVDALRERYPLPELLRSLTFPRSSYYYQRRNTLRGDKYHQLRQIIRQLFEINHSCYGYRRIHALLSREGLKVSEKVIRRLMAQEGLHALPRKRRRYNSYKGETSPPAPNLLERDFHADEPNQKWVTDITEFALPAGRVYLSPIVDCFDGLLPSWTISTRADAELANDMLDLAVQTLNENDKPIIHSDRGFHYRWPGWLARIEEHGLVRSMSRKACTADNAACEGFFGRLKNEMFYGRDWRGVTLEQFMDILDQYLVWYNHSRIKQSLGNRSPIEFRRSLGLVA